jgi:molecular chaperone HscB
LEKNYLAAQAVVHPDLYIERSEVEKKIAVQTSATLNEAYQRLKHIQTRAQEFLKAKKLPIPGENVLTIPASHLLGEVLDWREQIHEEKGLPSLHNTLRQRLEKCVQNFDSLADDQLSNGYLDLVYTQKTLTELERVLKK